MTYSLKEHPLLVAGFLLLALGGALVLSPIGGVALTSNVNTTAFRQHLQTSGTNNKADVMLQQQQQQQALPQHLQPIVERLQHMQQDFTDHLQLVQQQAHELVWEAIQVGQLQQEQVSQQPDPQTQVQRADSTTWPTDGADPQGNSCRDGFLTSPRKVFWQWANDTGPSLTDLFHAEDRVYAVFSIKMTSREHHALTVELMGGNWSMEFPSAPQLGFAATTLKAHSMGRDAHEHTFTITTHLPEELQAHPSDRSLRVNISLRHQTGNMHFSNVPLCVQPRSLRFKHLVVCTELTAAVGQAVPEWVAYHTLQGVEHFYLYINDDPEQVCKQLEPLVKAGVVTVVDWQWPERYKGQHMFQQAEQNGCLMRMRGQARWVALTDVDELLQCMVPGTTVAEFLQQHNVLDHVGSLIVQSVYFGSNANDTLQEGFARESRGLMLGKYRSREKCCEGQKMVANPRGMSYNSVHHITTGGPEHRLDAAKEMRLNHFKPGRKTIAIDNSLWTYADSVSRQLSAWGYGR